MCNVFELGFQFTFKKRSAASDKKKKKKKNSDVFAANYI